MNPLTKISGSVSAPHNYTKCSFTCSPACFSSVARQQIAGVCRARGWDGGKDVRNAVCHLRELRMMTREKNQSFAK